MSKNEGTFTKYKSPGEVKPGFLNHLHVIAPRLSYSQLVKAISILSKTRKQRFPRNPKKLSKGIDRTFTDKEFDQFLNTVPYAKYRMLFKLQRALAIRIGEVCKINLKDINWERKTIIAYLQKKRTPTPLPYEKPVPSPVYTKLVEYVQDNKSAIKEAKGYIFYADRNGRWPGRTHLNPNGVGNRMREWLQKAGLAQVYAHTRDGRPRYRLSTHSLKHTAVTKLYRQTGDIVLAQMYAGHEDIGTTRIYIEGDREKLKKSVESLY